MHILQQLCCGNFLTKINVTRLLYISFKTEQSCVTGYNNSCLTFTFISFQSWVYEIEYFLLYNDTHIIRYYEQSSNFTVK